MRNRIKAVGWLMFVVSVLGSFVVVGLGCAPAGYVNAAALDSTVRRVADRHDRYVAADGALSDVERRVDLRDTALLRTVLDAAARATTQPSR